MRLFSKRLEKIFGNSRAPVFLCSRRRAKARRRNAAGPERVACFLVFSGRFYLLCKIKTEADENIGNYR